MTQRKRSANMKEFKFLAKVRTTKIEIWLKEICYFLNCLEIDFKYNMNHCESLKVKRWMSMNDFNELQSERIIEFTLCEDCACAWFDGSSCMHEAFERFPFKLRKKKCKYYEEYDSRDDDFFYPEDEDNFDPGDPEGFDF